MGDPFISMLALIFLALVSFVALCALFISMRALIKQYRTMKKLKKRKYLKLVKK